MKKYKYYINIKIILFSLFLLSSCASIINGGRQSVYFQTTPPDALVLVDGFEIGRTPAKLKLKRGSIHKIEIKKEGYKTISLYTDKSLSTAFWGNCLIGGLIGMAIDLIDGSAYDVDPKSFVLSMEKSTNTGFIQKKLNDNINQIKILNENGVQLAGIQIQWE